MPKKKVVQRGPPPSKPCLAREYLMKAFRLTEETCVCKIGHVLLLHFDHKKSLVKTVASISAKFGFSPTNSQVISCVTKATAAYSKYNQHSSHRDRFVEICDTPFVNQYPPIKTSAAPSSVAAPPASLNPPQPEPTPLSTPPKQCNTPVASTSTQQRQRSASAPSGLHPSRTALTPRKLKMGRRLNFLSNQLASTKGSHRKQMLSVKNKMKEMPHQIRTLKQKVSRKESTIRILRTALKDKAALKHVKKAEQDLRRLKKRQKDKEEKMKDTCASQCKELQKQLAEKNQVIRELENDNVRLREEAEAAKDMPGTQPSKSDKKTYSSTVRMLVYDMVMLQVPTRNVSSLLETMSKRLGLEFEGGVPHRNTVEQIVREMGVTSDLQTAELLVNTSGLTLGFDATTQEGVHMNCIHVTSSNRCQIIAMDQLPGF